MLRTYRVTTNLGSVDVLAFSLAHAVRTGLELLGGEYRSCIEASEW
jgi:hypothetical protein